MNVKSVVIHVCCNWTLILLARACIEDENIWYLFFIFLLGDGFS